MKLLILCSQWGHEYLPLEDFFSKVKEAGYDGIDTWLPEEINERKKFIRLLEKYQLTIVDPRLAAWQEPVDFFLIIWEQIIDYQKSKQADFFYNDHRV